MARKKQSKDGAAEDTATEVVETEETAADSPGNPNDTEDEAATEVVDDGRVPMQAPASITFLCDGVESYRQPEDCAGSAWYFRVPRKRISHLVTMYGRLGVAVAEMVEEKLEK